ncbi:hypothetical protein ABZ686_02375 [Streptomyces sp. NPDC006992]|uniref:hypothetical protein n=1 Tax=Streptomyces sp. NPDC006992 TaxID=3155601 RepID=UPI0033DC7335
MCWEIAIPTLTADQRRGVQVFTYPVDAFAISYDAKRRAIEDAIEEAAVRHRRGADLDLSSVTVRTRTLDALG